MKSRILIATIIGFFLAISFSVQAQRMQQHQIAQGGMSGEINHREAALLKKQQRHICKEGRETKADGKVTMKERKRLHVMQHRANRSIIRAKHNRI